MFNPEDPLVSIIPVKVADDFKVGEAISALDPPGWSLCSKLSSPDITRNFPGANPSISSVLSRAGSLLVS